MADFMTPEKRSEVMSRIRPKNSKMERAVFRSLRKRRIYFTRHATDLPGRPDIVFRKLRIVVFIDSDFWHGWQFPRWEDTLPEYWQEKISNTKKRDRKNARKLRRLGWTVVRIWEHELKDDFEGSIDRIANARLDAVAGNECTST